MRMELPCKAWTRARVGEKSAIDGLKKVGIRTYYGVSKTIQGFNQDDNQVLRLKNLHVTTVWHWLRLWIILLSNHQEVLLGC
jgi:hypothetical protein